MEMVTLNAQPQSWSVHENDIYSIFWFEKVKLYLQKQFHPKTDRPKCNYTAENNTSSPSLSYKHLKHYTAPN